LGEKAGDNPPPGVPGLETALPLMLTAVAEGRLTLERLVTLMSANPMRIFDLPQQPDTWIEVDTDVTYELSNDGLFTRCGWTPFAGMRVRGRLERVTLRGKTVFEAGRVIA
jgi:carbamoyl-phosphate synthase/aspartate carbamoyltransferase/dihydroorotase